MNIVKKLIEKIKQIYKRKNIKMISEVNYTSDISQELESKNLKELFPKIEFNDELLNLALTYEKLKNDVSNEERKLEILDYKISQLKNNNSLE